MLPMPRDWIPILTAFSRYTLNGGDLHSRSSLLYQPPFRFFLGGGLMVAARNERNVKFRQVESDELATERHSQNKVFL